MPDETYLHVYMNEDIIKQFREGYTNDKDFAKALDWI